MQKRIYILLLELLSLVPLAYAAEVKNLRCEYQVNPIGIDVTSPRLSWNILSSDRGDYQQACQTTEIRIWKTIKTI
jgi:alpha-L-rhamnosidase